MSSSPKISIVTVHLNDGERLAVTAESVRRQHFADFEWIVKDAGSGTKPTWFTGKRWRWISCSDSGLYDGMNQAISLSSGAFINFINCGDEYADHDVLSHVAKCITAFPDIDWFYGDIFDAFELTVVKYPKVLTQRYMFRRTLCHQSIFYRRSILEKLRGFDCQFKICADNELLNRIIRSRLKGQKIDDVIVKYGENGVSASARGRELGAVEIAIIRRRYYKFWYRFWMSVVVAATLPRLRSSVLTWLPSGLRRTYRRIANWVNE